MLETFYLVMASGRPKTVFPESTRAVIVPPPQLRLPQNTDHNIRQSKKRKFTNEGLQTLRLPVKVREEQSSNSTNIVDIREGPPWAKYRQLAEEFFGGPTTVAYADDGTYSVYAVKEYRLKNPHLPCIRLPPHPNIVQVYELFRQGDVVHAAYEYIALSLADVYASPFGQIKELEVAAISKEVIE